MNGLIVATIAGGLLLDYHWAAYGQVVVNFFAWAVAFGLWLQASPRVRAALLACVIFATAGEIFLSLVWGLYEYRLRNIPLFVPPGHVLLYFLGTQIAARLPARSEWWITAAAAPLVMALAWNGRDTLGPILYALFIACVIISPSRRLYATMFVLSATMEIYGTWIGNWRWSAEVPYLGLTAMNPPLAAGAFYCVLDLLVVTATTRDLSPSRWWPAAVAARRRAPSPRGPE